MYRLLTVMASVWISTLVLLAMVLPVYAGNTVPTITSFTPTSGKAGDNITITGTYFTLASVVTFNGTLVNELTVKNATTITATVPVGATTGNISVTTAFGKATSAGIYYTVPVINSFSPTSGGVGDIITMTGTNFTGATAVNFNGSVAEFTVVNDISITSTVPEGATTGKISLITPGGNATSNSDFTVIETSTLALTIDPGAGYIGPLGDISLNYSLIGPQTYTGALLFNGDGKSLIHGLIPGAYKLCITSSHWLRRIIKGIYVDGSYSVNTELANGDANGDGQVNLFDFVVLDSKFNSADTMADLDGDGNVNLFDYMIIDQYFGAQGDSLLLLETKVNPKDGAEMVWTSSGDFLMGSSSGNSDESPQRSVYLDGFWMYKNEVTVAQYRAFCQTTGRSMPDAPNWGWQDTHPMVNVSWHDSTAYASWAGGSLPTEAQWEKAARGTDGRLFPWGNVWDISKCANAGNSSSGTKPVGSYPSGVSPFECMDMAGNSWEWCKDWYSDTYYQIAPGRNPLGPVDGNYRVMRGGSWLDGAGASSFRCSFRTFNLAANRYISIGFRCVKN